MEMNRRDFLKLLFGAAAFTALNANAATRTVSRFLSDTDKETQANDHEYDDRVLADAMIETLKLNEGLHLKFYRCTANKVTVGYGSNVQANPRLLDGIAIYRQGKLLAAAERKSLFDTLSTATKDNLAQYSISESDAAKITRKFLNTLIPEARRFLCHDKTGKTFFYDMPLCMQAMAMDILYNLGGGRFREYKKFKTALAQKDYAEATAQCKVYTNAKTKEVNKERERRKKRMWDIMRFVWDRPRQSTREILAQLEKDCLRQLKGQMDSASCQKELKCEKLLALGEIEHIRLMRERSKDLVQQKTAIESARPVVGSPKQVTAVRPVPTRGTIR